MTEIEIYTVFLSLHMVAIGILIGKQMNKNAIIFDRILNFITRLFLIAFLFFMAYKIHLTGGFQVNFIIKKPELKNEAGNKANTESAKKGTIPFPEGETTDTPNDSR